MVPTSLEYHSTISDSHGYVIHTVELLNHSTLLYGTGYKKVKMYDMQSQTVLKEGKFPSTVQSITKIPKSQDFIVLCLDLKAYMVSGGDMSNPKTLFTYNYSSYIPRVASHGDLVVMCNPYYRNTNQQLLVYSLTTGESDYYYLDGVNWIRSICFHPDGDLLVLNSEDGTVRKYSLYADRKPKLVSTVSGLPKNGYCSAMCVDNNGLIFITSYGQLLHIIYHVKYTIYNSIIFSSRTL